MVGAGNPDGAFPRDSKWLEPQGRALRRGLALHFARALTAPSAQTSLVTPAYTCTQSALT